MIEIDMALIVIDMQYAFQAARNTRTIRNVVLAIGKAIAADIPIFFLEYNGYTGTTRQVAQAAKGYEQLHVIIKQHDDGSEELMEYLEEKDMHISCFQVCGVNSCCCVARTVNSLVNDHQKLITMIDDGCNCKASMCKHKGLLITHDTSKNASIFQDEAVSIVKVA